MYKYEITYDILSLLIPNLRRHRHKEKDRSIQIKMRRHFESADADYSPFIGLNYTLLRL